MTRRDWPQPVPLWRALAVVILLFPFITGAASRQPVTTDRWDVMLAIDQSGSMFTSSDPCYDKQGNKFLPLRQEAAKKFIDLLSTDNAVDHQVGVVYFGGKVAGGQDAILEAPFFQANAGPAATKAKARLAENGCPPDLRWTNINAALELSYNELTKQPAQDEKSVVLLTDGVPEMDTPWSLAGKQTYYTEHFNWISKYKAAGIKIFVIALGDRAQRPDPDLGKLTGLPADFNVYKDLWLHAADQTGGRYYPLANKGEIWNVFHAIAAIVLGVSPQQTYVGEHPGGQSSIPITVGKCSRIVVTVDRDKLTSAALLDPAQKKQTVDVNEDTYQIYNVANPAAGTWTLSFNGPPTTYLVRLDCAVGALRLVLENQRSLWAQGKPMPLEVKVTNEAGEPEANALVGVIITYPDQSVETVSFSLSPTTPGLYTGLWNNTQQLGQHQLQFKANKDQWMVTLDHTLSLQPLLYLQLRQPEQGKSYQAAVVQAAIMRGTELQAGLAGGANPPVVTASLQSATGQDGGRITLQDDGAAPDEQAGDGIYAGRFVDVAEGDYVAVARLDAPAENAQDEVSASFHMLAPVPPTGVAPTAAPPPTPEPTAPPAMPRLSWKGAADVVVHAGDKLNLAIGYGTQGRSAPDKITFEVEGLPADKFVLEQPPDQTLLLPPGKSGEQSLSFQVDPAAGPAADEKTPIAYDGKLTFTLPDQTEQEFEFRVSVLAQRPPPPNLWPWAGLLVVLAGAGAFVMVDPFCLRCKLRGQLVYLKAPAGEGDLAFPLRGRGTTLVLSMPGGEALPFDFASTEAEPPPPPAAGSVTLRFRAQKSGFPRLLVDRTAAQEVRVNDIRVGPGGSIEVKPKATLAVGDCYELQYEHPGYFDENPAGPDTLGPSDGGGFEPEATGSGDDAFNNF